MSRLSRPSVALVVRPVLLAGVLAAAAAAPVRTQEPAAQARADAIAAEELAAFVARLESALEPDASAALLDLDAAVAEAAGEAVLDDAARAQLRALLSARLPLARGATRDVHRAVVGTSPWERSALVRCARWSATDELVLTDLEVVRSADGALRVRDRKDADQIAWVSVHARLELLHGRDAAPAAFDADLLRTWEDHALWRSFLDAARGADSAGLRAAWKTLRDSERVHPLAIDLLLRARRADPAFVDLALAGLGELGAAGLAHPLLGLEAALRDGDEDGGFEALADVELALRDTVTTPAPRACVPVELLRAHLFERVGEPALAAEAAELALRADPACAAAWRTAFRARVAAGEHGRAAELLLELPDVAPALVAGLLATPAGKTFAASPAHAAWRKAALAQKKDRVTLPEAVRFAETWIAAQSADDEQAVLGLIDMDTLLARSITGGPDAFRRAFTGGVKQGFGGQLLLSGQLGPGSTLRLLRVRIDAGRRVVLIGARTAEGGLGYFDYVLDRGADGRVRITDIRSYSAGEWMSALLRRSYLPLAAAQDKGLVERVFETESLFVKYQLVLAAMTAAGQKGEHAKVLAAFAELPEELQRERMYVLLRLRSAQALGGDEYLAAMQHARIALPGDPSLDLTSIDLHVLREEFDAAIECTRRLEAGLGGDPALASLRASLRALAGDAAGARKDVLRSLRRLPDPIESWWVYVAALLPLEAHGELLGALIEMDRRFAMEWNDFTTVPEYAAFVRSPEHASWKGYLEAKER